MFSIFVIELVTVLKVDSGLYQAVEHAQRLERSQAMYVMNLGETAFPPLLILDPIIGARQNRYPGTRPSHGS